MADVENLSEDELHSGLMHLARERELALELCLEAVKRLPPSDFRKGMIELARLHESVSSSLLCLVEDGMEDGKVAFNYSTGLHKLHELKPTSMLGLGATGSLQDVAAVTTAVVQGRVDEVEVAVDHAATRCVAAAAVDRAGRYVFKYADSGSGT
ncbi:hypothetical protein GPECTOR_182g262 [Gonium pectorale]|uniref:Uncharacterized protein n=1 Tax=Gonium pectorale TaxID=33097 RepID=A0A150FXA2_GONPE|nr:hypothetical protein GPECTOR_182g262 [Gonium pectorale]|eukprot:KXZ42207.1 hypothetical protein GPECTOR_182g262 [Gonium pectorale]